MSNPLNPDLTQAGYADGLRHGEAGQPKDQSRVIQHPKTWVFGNPAMDSYFEGYNQGHADGLAKRHGVYQPKPPPAGGGSTMTSGPDIHATIQPDQVAGFLNELRAFQRAAVEGTTALLHQVRALEDGRWNDPNYHEFLSRVLRVVRQMEHIDDHLIGQQLIPQLERIIAAARNARL